MLIQVWHARNSDCQNELYEPIKNAYFFPDHTWIFPHDGEEVDSRESLKNVDLFLAEVSTPATGLGIEIWFASAHGKRILCVYKKWSKISSSLRLVTENFIEYGSTEDIIYTIWEFLKNL